MSRVHDDPVSVAEAARLLGMTIDEVYELVFTRQLGSVEAPSGRRLVPRGVIEAWNSGRRPATA